MIEEPDTYIEIYLTKQGQNNLSKREMISLMQLLRITNALRFQMSLLLHTIDEDNRLFRLRAQVEIYTILASSFTEAVKEFYNHLFEILGPLSDEKELKDKLNEYGNKAKDYKNDEILQIIDYIRNKFSFHMDSKLFDNYIIEGDAKKDMLIGIERSEKSIDQCFLKAYDALIFQVEKMAKSLTDKSKIIDWLFDNILKETGCFCGLLEKFSWSIIKKYNSKKLAKNDNRYVSDDFIIDNMTNIRRMTMEDYEEVLGLLRRTPGVVVRDADSKEVIGRYLERNQGLSFVAVESGRIIGCIMSGHDGRRGYLQHLAVHEEFRRQGVGRALVERCLTELEKISILKSHIDVLANNNSAILFWERLGWKRRDDIYRYSFIRNRGHNA
jgi:N-acetylglutamate synthase